MSVRSIAEENRALQSFGRYTFPSSPGVHNIILHFRGYSYQGTEGTIKPKVGANSEASIVLPIPANLEDSYSIQINQFEMGTMGAGIADAISGAGRDAVLNDIRTFLSPDRLDAFGGGGVDNMIATGLSTARAAGAFIGRNLLDQLGLGGISGAVDVATGTAVNPHAALRFEGVDLKNHEFTWTLSPKNEEEARTLRDMINFIRSKALPTYATDGESSLSRALLNYPSLVDIYFTGLDQSYFYYFKPAMIKTFRTNYTPNGIALNRGGRPSVIQMSMSLSEARIHTSADVNIQG